MSGRLGIMYVILENLISPWKYRSGEYCKNGDKHSFSFLNKEGKNTAHNLGLPDKANLAKYILAYISGYSRGLNKQIRVFWGKKGKNHIQTGDLLRSSGDKLRSTDDWLRLIGDKLMPTDGLLRSTGDRLRSTVDRLRSTGDRLRSENGIFNSDFSLANSVRNLVTSKITLNTLLIQLRNSCSFTMYNFRQLTFYWNFTNAKPL